MAVVFFQAAKGGEPQEALRILENAEDRLVRQTVLLAQALELEPSTSRARLTGEARTTIAIASKVRRQSWAEPRMEPDITESRLGGGCA